MVSFARGKVGWLCTYTPEEIIHAAGFEPFRLLPLEDGTAAADRLLYSNLCPYARQVARGLEDGSYGTLAGVVVANSCHAALHLYSVFREKGSFFFYFLDLPRVMSRAAEEGFAGELERMLFFLSKMGEPVTLKRLKEAVKLYAQTQEILGKGLPGGFPEGLTALGPSLISHLAFQAAALPREEFNQKLEQMLREDPRLVQHGPVGESPCLLLTGSIPPRGLLEVLSKVGLFTFYPENCTGVRYFGKKYGRDLEEAKTLGELLLGLARAYLKKPPCPRFFPWGRRKSYFESLIGKFKVRGVIYHDLEFCDLSHYDFLLLKGFFSARNIPVLKVKTELEKAGLGQLQTRIEAFLEMIS